MRGGGILLFLALVRAGVEHGRQGPPVLDGATDELEVLRRESLATREEEERRRRPLEPGETVDPNRSPESELNRLPGVGAAVATALVESREEEGGFLTPEDLLRVRGIGPATLEKIRPYLDFSRGLPLELSSGAGFRGREGREARGAPTLTGSSGGPGKEGGAQPPVDVNRATASTLQTLPGIGPALAERIIASRARDGPFRTPEDLLRVPGIGPVTLERIRGRITLGR